MEGAGSTRREGWRLECTKRRRQRKESGQAEGWSGRADGSVRKDDVPVKCGNASHAAGRLGLRWKGWELLLR